MKNIFSKIFYLLFFIILIFLFVRVFLILVLIVLILLWLRSWQMKKEPNHKEFLLGKLPNPKPDGFYQGATGFNTSWLGKKFDAQNAIGTNIIKDKKGNQLEKYSFKTYVGKGLFDQNVFVLKIDYNIRGNPFWIRSILDEIVEVAPNEYLGKIHIRVIPSFPFSMLYFTLKKQL